MGCQGRRLTVLMVSGGISVREAMAQPFDLVLRSCGVVDVDVVADVVVAVIDVAFGVACKDV